MKILYSFYWDCGRMGSVDALFISDEETVNAALGKRVYFGEILGKHSEIYGTLKKEDITVVSTDGEKVEWLRNLLGSSVSGYNPLSYLECCHDGFCTEVCQPSIFKKEEEV